MRFSARTRFGRLSIRASLRDEDGDVGVGVRHQSDRRELELVDDRLFYSPAPSDLSTDALAMVCFVAFFPWIGDRVTFPSSVSDDLAQTLDAVSRRVRHRPLRVLDTGAALEPHRDDSPVQAHELAISFGGGVDSSALHVIFPEATLVHEVIAQGRRVPRTATVESMRRHHARAGTPIVPVASNARRLSDPPGVTTWLTLLLPSVLVALDRGLRGVLVGSNLPTMFMKSGAHYEPGHTRRSVLSEALQRFTVPIVQASGGISHLAAMRVCAEEGIVDTLVSCEKGRRGAPCGTCMKCFRRETIYRIVQRADPDRHSLDAFPGDMTRYGEKYDLEAATRRFHPDRPLSDAHNLALGRDFLGDEFPEPLRIIGKDVPDASFMWHRAPEADGLFPEAFTQHVLSRIHAAVPEMTPDEAQALRAWNGAGPAR